MASDEFAPFRVYRAVRRADVGMQLEQVFRALCFLLATWKSFGERAAEAHATGAAPHKRAQDGGSLNLIEFDKFCNVACRIWTVLFQRSGLLRLGDMDKLNVEEVQKLVRFKPPFEEIPGLHGPGEARTTPDSRQVYLVQMLRDLDAEGVGYFSFKPPATKDDGIGSSGDDPSSTTIAPALLVTDDHNYWQGFTNTEVTFLKLLGSAICHLSPNEIRALGTHRDSSSTVAEVERELRWARRKAQELAVNLGAGIVVTTEALRLHMFVNEAKRKATENSKDYAAAFASLSTELHDDAREAFLEAHQPAADVWSDSRLTTLNAAINSAIGPAEFLFALAFFQSAPEFRSAQSTRRSQEMRRRWYSGRAALTRDFGISVPETISAAFSSENAIDPGLAASLANVLRKI